MPSPQPCQYEGNKGDGISLLTLVPKGNKVATPPFSGLSRDLSTDTFPWETPCIIDQNWLNTESHVSVIRQHVPAA